MNNCVLTPESAAGRLNRIGQFKGLLLVSLSVGFVYLASPGGPAPWLAWIAMLPLGLALHRQRPRQAFMLAFSFGFCCWFVSTWWVVPGIAIATGAATNTILLLELLLCVLYALPYGLAGLLYSRCLATVGGAITGALIWTAICCMVPHILPGNLAHTQYLYPRVIQVLDLGGVPLLFFILHCCNWLLVSAWVQIKESWSRALRSCGVAVVLLLMVLGYGELRLRQLNAELNSPSANQLTVGMVQPNITLAARDRASRETVLPVLEVLTRKIAGPNENVDLVIWPEIPTPISYSGNKEDQNRINRLVRETGTPLMLAGLAPASAQPERKVSVGSDQREYYNVVELIDENGLFGQYRKQRLMPFGEYLPGEKILPFLRAMLPDAPRYVAGDSGLVMDLKAGIRIVPLICYEAVFTSLTAAALEPGGDIIINAVNDAWFGNTAGADFHLALALYRSVEFRIPLVRVSNSGITTVIRSTGVFDTSMLRERFVSSTQVRKVSIVKLSSFYARTGDLFLYVTVLLSGFLVFVSITKKDTSLRRLTQGSRKP